MATEKDKLHRPDSNRDPITAEPGAHPVGAGVGAAVGGGAGGAALGAAGAAIGSAAGPVGTVVGAIAGGVAGGLVGKQVAERINPTAEDAYWRSNYQSRPYVDKGASYDEYRPAYRYGWESHGRHAGKRFEQVETELRSGWDKAREKSKLSWDKAKNAVRDAWERVSGGHQPGSTTATQAATCETSAPASAARQEKGQASIQLREEELHAQKQPVEKGDVRVRKDVVTEHKTLDVPVRREEVVVERHPVAGKPAAASDIRPGEEIRIPVKEEEVNVEKRPVVREEVSVGKHQVQDSQKIEGSVRKEQLRIEKEGEVKVRGDTTQNKK